MYEPHLTGYENQQDMKSFDGSGGGEKVVDLLAELDKIAPIKSFDAFPKVQSTYTTRSRRGGIVTAVISAIIFLLILMNAQTSPSSFPSSPPPVRQRSVFTTPSPSFPSGQIDLSQNDLGEYLFPLPTYSFSVDPSLVHKTLQLNVDMTVGMSCHYLTIDLRDVLGDRLHLSDDFQKDGTIFEIGKALSSAAPSPTTPSASKVIHDARRSLPSPKSRRSTSSGLRTLFGLRQSQSSLSTNHKQIAAYRPTLNKQDDGPACRIYGSVEVKKVMANLHVTTLGHGYQSWEHTGHDIMNLSHIIHEFSFGPYFPAIAQPLDMSYASTEAPFSVYQYFLSVVPTIYIDSRGRRIRTSQYAVTDYSRDIEHGKGVPGIFFKFDIEPLSMKIEERSASLYNLLVRLIGVIGGVWTTAAFALRVLSRAEREVKQKVLHLKTSGMDGEEGIIPKSAGPTPVGTPNGRGMMARSGSWLGGGGEKNGILIG